MINSSNSILNVSLLSLLLVACGGGGDGSTKDAGANDGGSSQTSNLEIKLPFELDDDTGKVRFNATFNALGMFNKTKFIRHHTPKLSNFIKKHTITEETTGREVVDELIKLRCIDHGSIDIQSNLPSVPWYTNRYGYYLHGHNPLELKVNANECYSKLSNGFGNPKYVDGSVEVNLFDDEQGNRVTESSTAKYTDYAIGYGKQIPSTKGDKNFERLKKLNVLLTGTRKVVIIKEEDPVTKKTKYISVSSTLTNAKLKHSSGEELFIEDFLYKTDDATTRIDFTVNWVVTNTTENIELVGHAYLRPFLFNEFYDKDYVYPKGDYRLHYTFDMDNTTGAMLITVDLISHGIRADIVQNKEHTNVTYNRNGSITKVTIK